MITDLHFADRIPGEGNNRYYNQSLTKLSECVSVMNEEKVDFLIQLGDFKDQDEVPNEKKTLKYLSAMEKEFSRFNGAKYHVLGNHDHDSISKRQFLKNVSISGFKEAKNFYSFDKNDFHFIVLDANYTSQGMEYDHGNFDWKDANIPANQLLWLEKDLEKTQLPTVVFVHQRLDENESNAAYCVNNSGVVRSVLEKSEKVILVLQGHYHEGDNNKINSITYFTLKAAVEGPGLENNSFAILDINSDLEMVLTGFKKEKSLPIE
ncbi:metallophosphoesterase [Membranihabitans marinus]